MKTFLFALLVLLALAGCGGSASQNRTEPGGNGGSSAIAVGPGISIEEAIASTLEGPLLVNGSVLADGGQVRFCSALAESFPPQCGEPSLRIEGLKLAEVDDLQTASDVSWSNGPVQLLGTVEDGVLTVSTTSL
ncbi:MAG: hypothetical protein ABI649_05705 [Gaiellaceae bacterium]